MTFQFKTVDEAEKWYYENMAINNEDEAGCAAYLEDITDDIEESYLENHPKVESIEGLNGLEEKQALNVINN